MTTARNYFRSQAKLLHSQYESSTTSHKGDTGANREEILTRWLEQHLPNATSPKIGGQIIDSTGHITGQVDVVLYNDNAPKFGGNPKSYYFAEGIIAAIQVKSKLTSNALTLAVNNLETVRVCRLQKSFAFIVGRPSENIMTGIFAFELDTKDFASIHSVVESLKRREAQGKKPVDFVCINQKGYIAYNKGEWHTNDSGKTPLPNGYIEADLSEECIFRMVLALSSEAKKNIATAIDFQPYFIDGWSVS